MFRRIWAALAAFHKSHRYPIAVIASLGLGGFLLDYFWRPISTAGLILLGLAASPWLIKVVRVRKGTVAAWEFELGYPSAPLETGERLAAELREGADDTAHEQISDIAEQVAEAETQGGQLDPEPAPATAQEDDKPTLLDNRRAQVARAYLAEGLVFQELQREFGGTVQKEVRIGPYAIDGIVFGPSGPVAVEVKILSSGKALRNRIVDAAARLLQVSLLEERNLAICARF